MKKVYVLLMILLSALALSATAEIQFVSRASEYEEIKTSSPTTLTLSAFDAGYAPDTFIVISVTSKLKDETDNPVISVTFNGASIPMATSEMVDDTYEGWANLYIAPAIGGAGNIDVKYQAPTDDKYDAISISVASYSGVKGIGSTSRGTPDSSSMTELSDSITTTASGSLVVSSLMLGGSGSMEGMNSTKVRVNNDGARIGNGLLDLVAPQSGRYKPGATFPNQVRAVIVSAELLAK